MLRAARWLQAVARLTEAGQLRHRITIEQKTRTGTAPNVTETWAALKSNLPAKYEPMNGREIVTADQMVHRETARFTIRRRTDVTAAMRVVYKSRTYAILGIRDIDDAGWRWTEISCEEGAPS